MTRYQLFFLATLGIAAVAGAQQTPPPAPSDPAIQAITQSPNPSAAVAAYAAALAHPANLPSVEQAYLHRMIDFNLPDLAITQAQDLIRRDPNNSVARAVIAYVQGRRGQVIEALTSIVQAATPAGNGAIQPIPDPFILRTAGQLVAWYDTHGDKAQIPPSIQQGIEQMRRSLSAEDVYTQAYDSARDTYQGKSNPAVPQYIPAPQVITPDVSSSAGYDNSYPNYPTTYDYQPYYNPYPFYYPGYYSPGILIPSRHHFHDGDHSHDGDHGHDWDHGHDGDHSHDWDHGHDGHNPVVGTPGHQFDQPHPIAPHQEIHSSPTPEPSQHIEPHISPSPSPSPSVHNDSHPAGHR